ncbi:MAG: hypothetical protein ACJ712_12165, partial [Nitrososphaeraceae archaeon]
MNIARILQGEQETFAIVTEKCAAITREELINQTGLLLPLDLEQFIFEESFRKINHYGVDKLSV